MPIVLCVLFFIVEHLHVAVDHKIEKLTNRHAGINAYGLSDRNLERPGVAEADIPFARCCVDVYPQSADRALSFEKWDVAMCLGVLLR